jgi:hypothetical protein
MERLSPKQQGDLGEADAIATLARLGGEVSVPLFSSPDYDLVVDFGDGLLRVQVKTSTLRKGDRYVVHTATNGGNRSWSGRVKLFSHSRCDLLFVLVADGRRWLIPATAVDGRTSLRVGGPKYSEYELRESEDGPAIPAPVNSAHLRGSAGAGEPGRTVNSVATPEWVRIPPPPLTAPRASSSAEGVRSVEVGRTRISAGHQLTIPVGPFRAADLSAGDRLEVLAEGPGRIALRRVHPASPSARAG